MAFDYNLEKQHAKGKLHAIERINLLCDKDSFVMLSISAQVLEWIKKQFLMTA